MRSHVEVLRKKPVGLMLQSRQIVNEKPACLIIVFPRAALYATAPNGHSPDLEQRPLPSVRVAAAPLVVSVLAAWVGGLVCRVVAQDYA